MRTSKAEQVRQSVKKKSPKVETDLEGLFTMMLGGPMLPTQRAFIFNNAKMRALKGNEGSAKTSALCAFGLSRALLQPGSKGLCARADYNDLKDTTMRTMEDMLTRLPKGVLLDRNREPPEKWFLRPVSQDGSVSEITWMGLKNPPGSYEFNWAIVDEAVEVEEKFIHQLDGRLRAKGGDYAIALAFNPPLKDHWLYTACTGKDVSEKTIVIPWIKLFEPHYKENANNLPEDYYTSRLAHYTKDQQQRLIYGDWGDVYDGAPVYREFVRSIHCTEGLTYFPGKLLLRAWDFGYNHPACLIAQIDDEGRLIILEEIITEKVEIQPFARRVKQQTAVSFPGSYQDVRDYGDPAAIQKKDTGSTVAVLQREGITLYYRTGILIEESVRAVRKRFEEIIRGLPAIRINAPKCPVLVSALSGGYRMDKNGHRPLKDGFYEHVADAFRYLIVNLYGVHETHKVPLLAPASTSIPESLEYDARQDYEMIRRRRLEQYNPLGAHQIQINGQWVTFYNPNE